MKDKDKFNNEVDKIVKDINEFVDRMDNELNNMHTTISDYLYLVNCNNQREDEKKGIKITYKDSDDNIVIASGDLYINGKLIDRLGLDYLGGF